MSAEYTERAIKTYTKRGVNKWIASSIFAGVQMDIGEIESFQSDTSEITLFETPTVDLSISLFDAFE